MIDISKYPKFAKDIDTKNPQVEAILCLGWIEKQSPNESHPTAYTELGMPYSKKWGEEYGEYTGSGTDLFAGQSHETIFLANGKQTLLSTPMMNNQDYIDWYESLGYTLEYAELLSQNRYYADVDLNIGTFTESLNFADKKYKINNITAKMTNFMVDNVRMSDRLNEKNWLNQKCAMFWKTPSCKQLSDCFPMFIGHIRRIRHDNTRISFLIEDFSESFLKKDLPIRNMPQGDFTIGSNRNKPIPIVYGNVDAVPVPFTQGEERGAQGSSRIKLYVENAPLEEPIEGVSHTIGGNQEVHVSPVYVYSNDRYYSVMQKGSGIGHRNYEILGNRIDFYINEYDIIGEADDPIYQDGNSDQDGTLLEDLIELGDNVINDTHINTLKLQIFQKPNNVSVQEDDTLINNTPDLAITSSTGGISEDNIFDMTKAYDESADGLLNTESYVKLKGKISPRARGLNRGYSFGFRVQFDNADIPFSGELLDVEGTNVSNPTQTMLLLKYYQRVSTKIEYSHSTYSSAQYPPSAPKYFNWDLNEGHRFTDYNPDNSDEGYGLATSYYPDDYDVGRIWIDVNNSSKHFARSSSQHSADTAWYQDRGLGRGFNTNADNGGGTSAELEHPHSRYRSRTLNNIDADIAMNAYDIPGDNYNTLYIGCGKLPYASQLFGSYYYGLNQSNRWQYFHDAEMRLYNIRLYKEIRVNNMYNKEYFVRVNKGRKFSGTNNTPYAQGFTWIFKNILMEELGVKEYQLDQETYNHALSFETDFSRSEAGLALIEKTNSKDFIESIMKSSPFLMKVKYDGTFAYSFIKKSYSPSDLTGSIKKLDVLDFNYSQSSVKDLTTKIDMYYHKDYGRDSYNAFLTDKITNYVLNNGKDEYSADYYGLNLYNSALGLDTHTGSTKVVESDVIRSKSIWETGYAGKQVTIEEGMNDGYASDYAKYELLNNCQQKLLINLTLPLSYLWLETGDIVHFDELLEKAYSHDYTKLLQLNGMWAYPAFIVTKVQKSQTRVKCILQQLWYLNDDNNHTWQTEEEETLIWGCMEENAINFNPLATASNGSCVYLGDPNADGVINVVDIVMLVNQILSPNPDEIYENTSPTIKAMDLNEDGIVNVTDIVAMVNIILGSGELEGCLNPEAYNYNSQATVDNNTCVMPNYVCGNPHAVNYDESGLDSTFLPLTNEQLELLGFGGGAIDLASENDEICNFTGENYPTNLYINQEGLGAWGNYLQHTMQSQYEDWYAPYWRVGLMSWWQSYQQNAFINMYTHDQFFAHYHLNNDDYNFSANELTPRFLSGGLNDEMSMGIDSVNMMLDSTFNTYVANHSSIDDAWLEYTYKAFNRFPVGYSFTAFPAYSGNQQWQQEDNEIILNRYYWKKDNLSTQFFNRTQVENFLNLNQPIAEHNQNGNENYFEEITPELGNSFMPNAGDMSYFSGTSNNVYIPTSTEASIFRRVSCMNGQLITDPDGNCEGMGDHYGFYANNYIDTHNAFGSTNYTANNVPSSILINFPLWKGQYNVPQQTAPFISPDGQNQYDWNFGQGPNYTPPWLEDWEGYPDENPWENVVNDSGCYQIEFSNITMTELSDKLQIMVWVSGEERGQSGDGQVGFKRTADDNCEPVGNSYSLVYNRNLLYNEVYDEFGNMLSTTGKFPRIKIDMPSLTSDGILKHYCYIAVIYHNANNGNRLGFTPSIKRLGDNFEQLDE